MWLNVIIITLSLVGGDDDGGGIKRERETKVYALPGSVRSFSVLKSALVRMGRG